VAILGIRTGLGFFLTGRVICGERIVLDYFEAGVLDVRIDLNGADAGMAQHHCGQII
jgi:hypothetical protein